MFELRNVCRKLETNSGIVVKVLNKINLTIPSGDFVAITGSSGSGKSTILNILNLIDQPDEGQVYFDNQLVSDLDGNELAVLRQNIIGRVFQDFNLLPGVSALQNVSMPLIYSRKKVDISRSISLLKKVGLFDRQNHMPSQLSGGQQQKVAIARSLVNSPRLILADEPTGNLDSESEKVILNLLSDLNKSGVTVVVVTHDPEVARSARRLIRVADGKVVSDIRVDPPVPTQKERIEVCSNRSSVMAYFDFVVEAFRSLSRKKLRTVLSIIGIFIAITSIATTIAVGNGASNKLEFQLRTLGSNLLTITPSFSYHMNDHKVGASSKSVLRLTDVEHVKSAIPFVRMVSPIIHGRVQVQFESKNWSTFVIGTNPEYTFIHSSHPEFGRMFDESDLKNRRKVVVIGKTVAQKMFGHTNAIGKKIKLNRVEYQIIGILPVRGGGGNFLDQDDVVLVPVTTAMYRLLGRAEIDSIELEVVSENWIDFVKVALLDKFNGVSDVEESNLNSKYKVDDLSNVRNVFVENSKVMSSYLSAIALISLLVGSVGVFNMMLVSVAERKREIGIRFVVGARKVDIIAQLLVESLVISLFGGTMALLAAFLIVKGAVVFIGFESTISFHGVLISIGFASIAGLVSGIYPAYLASLVSPVDALRKS